mmetsp:Transcript_79970/g.126201  ORF Transcript_79970/g.126201 Transcript_79970/m.126201 type:complete len:140 (+) Transcript_79970:348-767(+)
MVAATAVHRLLHDMVAHRVMIAIRRVAAAVAVVEVHTVLVLVVAEVVAVVGTREHIPLLHILHRSSLVQALTVGVVEEATAAADLVIFFKGMLASGCSCIAPIKNGLYDDALLRIFFSAEMQAKAMLYLVSACYRLQYS